MSATATGYGPDCFRSLLPIKLPWRSRSFISEWLSTVDSFFIRHIDLCQLCLSNLKPLWKICVQAGLCVLLQYQWVHMCINPFVSRRPCFFCDFYLKLLLKSSDLFFHRLPWDLMGRDLMEKSHLDLTVSGYPPFCILCSCESLYLLLSTTGGICSNDGWARHWYMNRA